MLLTYCFISGKTPGRKRQVKKHKNSKSLLAYRCLCMKRFRTKWDYDMHKNFHCHIFRCFFRSCAFKTCEEHKMEQHIKRKHYPSLGKERKKKKNKKEARKSNNQDQERITISSEDESDEVIIVETVPEVIDISDSENNAQNNENSAENMTQNNSNPQRRWIPHSQSVYPKRCFYCEYISFSNVTLKRHVLNTHRDLVFWQRD